MSSWKGLFLSPFLCLNRRIFSQVTTYPSSSPPSRLCSVTIFSIRPTLSFLFKIAHWLPTGLASLVAQWQRICLLMQKMQQVGSLSWEDPLEEDMATTPVFLPGESHGQRSLAGYSPWGLKELDMTSTHFKLWELACPALPGTFLVLTLQVPHPKNLLL